jgi:hypothetical protein
MSTDTRIESLEHQVRTLKRMLFGVFGLVVVGGLLAATTLQSVPDVLRAKSFEVVNGEGKVLGSLKSGSEGGELGLNSKGGKKMVGLSTGDEGGSLMMLTEEQKLFFAVVSRDGSGELGVYGKAMKPLFIVDSDGVTSATP